jgi:pimeloyl-ACP methyl ester carboxylesterase
LVAEPSLLGKQYESALRDEFRLVAYDLRGHGMSEAPLAAEHYADGQLWADDLGSDHRPARPGRARACRNQSASTAS